MKRHHVFILLFILLAFSACRTTRTLQENEYLHRKNNIKFEGKNPGINEEDIHAILQPRPNKKFLGVVPLKIWFYNLGSMGKGKGKIKKWLREGIGEQPVLYDSMQVKNSLTEVTQYLKKVGYFNAEVNATTTFQNNKTHTKYYILPGEPYRIGNYFYEIEDSVLKHYITENRKASKIKGGSIFNAFKLDNERERITAYLRNNGYYFFDRNFIYFEVDSTLGNREMDLFLKVKDKQASSDSVQGEILAEAHKRYLINKIYINPFFDPVHQDYSGFDTTVLVLHQIYKDSPATYYYFIHKGKLRIHPKIVSQSIFITSGEPFKALDVRKTQLRFNELGLFNYSNILFRKAAETQQDSMVEHPMLDCSINLTRKKLHSFTIEAEGTNKAGKPGIGANFIYQNNNFFRGSEIFQFRINGSLEFQKAFIRSNETPDVQEDYSIFSTVETGGEINIVFPRFLIPIKQERFPKYFKPKTTLRLGLSYERRPQYTRYINNITFGYDWKESEFKTHILNPIIINVVEINVKPEYQEIIDDEPNDRIRNQYIDHLILALNYSFVYNNQEINKLKNFFYFRGTIETAGNLLNLLKHPLGAVKDTSGYYTIFGIRYSQYTRGDVDVRYYHIINKDNSLVYRLLLGVGLPYGNSTELPLEKGFYGGGANDMRGWPYRLLGPGSYSNPTDFFDRMGDMQIEANIEYRFPIYKWFKGALFLDIGNVWLLKKNSSYPGGEFEIDDFISELAVDAGFGFRLDFNFFIIRLDAAVKIRDPAQPLRDRWVLDKFQLGSILWNLGIGYPF